MQAYIQIFTR